jgi:hypothetical protein
MTQRKKPKRKSHVSQFRFSFDLRSGRCNRRNGSAQRMRLGRVRGWGRHDEWLSGS